MGEEIVTLYVGPTRKKFIVHKNLICDSSDFFKKAFTGNFVESKEGTINLSEDDPDVISIFIHWLYTAVVPLGNAEDYLHNLYELYFFADKVCLTVLKDATMDSIQDMSLKHNFLEKLVAPDLVCKVLKALPPRDKGLRRFCIEALTSSYLQRATHVPNEDDLLDPDFDDAEEDTEEEKEVVYLKKADINDLWRICKDDAKFFQRVLDLLGKEMQIGVESTDPARSGLLKRDEGSTKGRCWFHCHKKGVNCRATPDGELPNADSMEE
jgi:hypothetical protein